MKVVMEPAFPGTLAGAPARFDWPFAQVGGRNVDLRLVPPAAERQLYFFYGTDMQAGWCALTNTRARLACALLFDQKVFPTCWLFASFGGWRNLNVAVLEPCTGYPLDFEALRAAGRHRLIAPGESLATAVQFVVQEGLQSVARIDPQGALLGD